MSGIKDSERIEALRKRLYERGTPEVERTKHTLTDAPVDVPHVWKRAPQAAPKPSTPPPAPVAVSAQPRVAPPVAPYVPPSRNEDVYATPLAAPRPSLATMSPRPQNKRYRFKMIAAGLIFFVLSIMVSILFMTFGNGGISGENITITATGPFTIGGGEIMPIQVGLHNNNQVAIESATLIVEYPRGTLSANEERKELYSERLPLDVVAAGETINVPIRAIVFGEENQEQEIKVSVEYRVAGSNALFFKEAEPLRFKISSSPLVVNVDALKKISSGQETELTLEIKSNAQNTMSDVLLIAEYPLGFSYTSADPAPTSGQNQWQIDTLDPEQKVTIKIKGVVVGQATDEYAVNFAVGVPNERDSRTLASIFATAQTQFEIEQPFLDIDLEIAGVVNGTAVVKPVERSSVSIEVTNTLQDSIYDIVAEVQLSGNAISDLEVGPPSGFYDSNTKKIIWDISSAPELENLAPGETARLTFAIAPSEAAATSPEINIAVNIKARRVSESQAAETLTGTAKGTMKVASALELDGFATHSSGVFTDVGPVPPRPEQKTSYTLSFSLQNGTNDIAGGVMTATLPTYVTWENQTAGTGTFSYDQVKRLVTWNVGKVEANASVFGSIQVSLVPSRSQLATEPTLVGEQFFRADDLFTGSVVRDTSAPVTTEISTEAGFDKGNGTVVE